jgi:membrane protease YdiL (CAAX protease family)
VFAADFSAYPPKSGKSLSLKVSYLPRYARETTSADAAALFLRLRAGNGGAAIDTPMSVASRVAPGDGGTPDPVPARLAGFREVPWRWYDGFIALVILLPWRFLLLLPRAWVLPLAQLPFWQMWLVVFFVPVAWRCFFPLGMAYRRTGALLIHLPPGRTWLRETAVALVTLVIGVAVLVAAVAGWFVFARPSNEITSVWSGGASDRVRNLDALLLLSAMTVAPVTEELFFRGLVYTWLRRFTPLVVAILLQAAIFALLHPFTHVHLVIAFVFGIVQGGLYEWRKTLLTPILFHAMYNTLATIAVTLLGEG